MQRCYYDLPSKFNHDQFSKTTTEMAITMGSDIGVYGRDLSMAFTKLDLVMPIPIKDPVDDATPVQMHRWKSQVREFEDKTMALIGFKAKVFLKVEGRSIRHRDYDTDNTEKDGFALLTTIEGISIGIEGRRNTAVLSSSAKDQYIKIRQDSMALME